MGKIKKSYTVTKLLYIFVVQQTKRDMKNVTTKPRIKTHYRDNSQFFIERLNEHGWYSQILTIERDDMSEQEFKNICETILKTVVI